MRIGIDATWLKPKKSGGVEVFLENIMHGILKLPDNNEYILFTAKDNDQYLKGFFDDDRVSFIVCDTNANDVAQHLWWQNTKQYLTFKKNNIHVAFFPVYEMPIYNDKGIKCVTVIHDLQAAQFPEYFKLHEKVWFKIAWPRVVKNSEKVIGISEFTKNDIISRFGTRGNVIAICNPVVLDNNNIADFTSISKEYKIEKNNYYYTVCSMHKHKNLITLLKVIKEIKDKKIDIPDKLVISGVGGPNKETFYKQVEEIGISDSVVLTSFVSDEVRNSLIKNSNCFLFPSIFEGFGMPPVEAMELGARTITTNMTSLPEVTQGKCSLIMDPFSVEEWIDKIQNIQSMVPQKIHFKEYEDTYVARKYLDTIYEVAK